jgi:hypothetical protein
MVLNCDEWNARANLPVVIIIAATNRNMAML